MIFAHPVWLLAALVALGGLYWVSRRYDTRQRAALEQFVSVHLRGDLTRSVSHARIVAKRVLFAASLVLLCIALAEPQAGFRWEQVKRRGHDIIFAVDTSRSMLTPDVKPNRLARAKLAIDDFVSHLNGDAVGLVAFAGSAFLQTPITLDYGAFHESLNALDTNIIPRGGTDITSSIQEADAALQHRADSDKVMILVTDGEDLEGNALAAAKAAAKDGLKIFTVGVGSANGELIPLPADQGGGFLKDNEGRLVKSRLDESALKALAEATGGSYAPLGAENQGLDTIYREALAPLAKHDLESRSQKIYTERYQWPLGASLALLMGSLLLGTRRRFPAVESLTEEKRSLARFAMPTSAAVLGLVALVPFHSAHASPASAAQAYAHGNFTAAEHDYMVAAQSNPKQPLLQYNEGAAAYKAGEFPQAAQAFQASVDASPSGNAKRLAEQEDAYYNLGNTLYREGQKTQQGNAEQTIQTWTQAVKAYDAALQLRAQDTDSKFNRDLVNRKLAALKKEQSEKKPPEQPSQSQKQSSKPQQGQQSQGKDKQGKDNSAQSKGQSQGGQPSPQPNGQPQAQQASGANSGEGQKNPAPQGPQTKQQEAAQGAAQKNEPSPAAPGSLPRPDRSQGGAGSPGEQPGEQTAQNAGEPRVPGEMSRDEARELLDSVKDEEHRAPAAPVARNGGTTPDEPLKNW
ncbi:MAG: VWA domain-containing protein [Steroidobacteraceae bacterium]